MNNAKTNFVKQCLRIIKVKIHLWNNRRYWKMYYRRHRENAEPSSFAVFCLANYIKENGKLLELGCGNGRDAFFFAKNKVNVNALDIEGEEIGYLKKQNKNTRLDFMSKDFTTFSNPLAYDYVYSRFTLHSISLEDELNTLSNTYNNLKKDGIFLAEVRSIKDEMFEQSQKISENEGKTDHYRRFLNFEEFKNRLISNGFEIVYGQEAQNLAVHGNENPWIIRVVAKKSL